MVLAGDRSTTTLPLPVRHTTPTPSGPISPPAPTPNAGPATGAKRPGPEANSPEQANKRVKAEKSQSPVGSASGSASSRAPKRMVIEVLNTPSIASPLPRTSSVVNEEKQSRASQERREERREEATSGMEIDERAARISTPLPPPAPLSPQTVLHPLHPPILLNRLLVRLRLLPAKPRKKRLDLLRLLYQMHHPLQQPRQPLYHSSLRETRTLALLLCLLPRLLRVHPSRRQQVPVIVEMPLWPMPRWRDEARKRTTLSPRMDECDVFEEHLKGLRRRIIVRDERRRS